MRHQFTTHPGRKATTAKRITFCAPQDIVDILDQSDERITDYICQAIRLRNNIEIAKRL